MDSRVTDTQDRQGSPGQNALRSGRGKLYEQIATLIRNEIVSGRWVPGERLPSLGTLAERHGVALVTVRQAVALLEEDGIVRRRQGKGTFVSDTLPEQKWLKLESNWQSMLKMWGRSKPRLLKVADDVASPFLAEEDGKPARSYRYMRRVHMADGVPYAVVDIYVDQDLYARAPNKFDSEMVVVVLDRFEDVSLTSVRQRLTIGSADLETAELLNIPVNAPVGKMRRVLKDQHGTVIYVGEAIYRGDLVRLEREIQRPD
ncbi:MAG: GntR family transcriptional regulator [Sediminimonas qiaohouensis]|uniref:GntR family transcriptional regulator n=1 Tax=Sediminimonas qiaohouensis TaxID=552061 RepID=A0A7C9HB12_9RHOB|nr:GntR family transcriptional regulator [Sediminimonas qiaohouensis]